MIEVRSSSFLEDKPTPAPPFAPALPPGRYFNGVKIAELPPPVVITVEPNQ